MKVRRYRQDVLRRSYLCVIRNNLRYFVLYFQIFSPGNLWNFAKKTGKNNKFMKIVSVRKLKFDLKEL